MANPMFYNLQAAQGQIPGLLQSPVRPPWQNNLGGGFPVPPRGGGLGGLLGPIPNNNPHSNQGFAGRQDNGIMGAGPRDGGILDDPNLNRNRNSGSNFMDDRRNPGNGILDGPRKFGGGILDDRRNQGNGILDGPRNPGGGIMDDRRNQGNGILNGPRNSGGGILDDRRNFGGGILDGPRNSGGGILDGPPRNAGNVLSDTQRNVGGGILGSPGMGNRNNNRSNQTSSIPSLFSQNIMGGMGNNNDRFQGNNRNNAHPNNSNRNYMSSSQGKNQSPNNNRPIATVKKITPAELLAKAKSAKLYPDFFDEVKSTANKSRIYNLSLERAQKEYCKKKNKPFPMKVTGTGQHFCNICKVNYDTRNSLTMHYKTQEHKELEDDFDVKKEQARLILEDKLKRPIEPITEEPSRAMVGVFKAEVEMNLKPREIDLDAYILGVYESIMKPYWPVPKSAFYCRICNYQEFSVEAEYNRHKNTTQHLDREHSYDDAFCLFCQQHNGDKRSMADHEKTAKHSRVKDLMETTKQCAVEHWHQVNNKELPQQYRRTANQPDPKVGNKRSALDDSNNSPTKKINSGTSPSSKSIPAKVNSQKDKKVVVDLTKSNANKSSDPVVIKASGSKDTTTSINVDSTLSPADSTWFAPIYGFMCIACRKFLSNATEQKQHAQLASHSAAIEKFKKTIVGV